jgi:type II secretory pathway pseudopilin PulG
MSPTRNSSEAGFTLAGLIVVLTIISIMIAYTIPHQWSIATARDRDRQTLFAMRQYARAIKSFQESKTNPAHTMPTSLDQLKQARNPRVIRGKGEFIDPLTGQVDWIPIPFTPQQPGGNPVVAPIPGRVPTPVFPPPPQTKVPVNPTQPGQPGGFVGPLIGVRPNKTGKSYIFVNGNSSYEQWSYTTIDLQNEIALHMNAMMVK